MRHTFLLLSSAQAQTLDLVGTCPGPIDFTLTGLSPSRTYAIVSSSGTGAAVVPPGQACAGTPLGVSGVGLALRAVRNADRTGGEQFTFAVPAAGCGLALQALDLTTCAATNVAFLPRPVVSTGIAAVQQGQHATYDVVNVTGVITATEPYGVWISNGTSNAYSGLFVYLNLGWEQVWTPLYRGDLVEVQGDYVEYFGLTEIDVAGSPSRQVSLVSTAAEPAPRGISLSALLNDPEPWEGVVLRLSNVTVASLPNRFGEWTVTDGVNTLIVDDQVYDASAGLYVGQPLQFVQGVLGYSFNTWRLLPRAASDLR